MMKTSLILSCIWVLQAVSCEDGKPSNQPHDPVCQDGIVEGAEECDQADLGGFTCATLGATGGTLACTPQCAFDLGGCDFPAPETRIRKSRIAGEGGGFCRLDVAGRAGCWGHNVYEGTGRERDVASEVWTPALGDTNFIRLALTQTHGCGLDATGRVLCWGRTGEGAAGAPDPILSPEGVQEQPRPVAGLPEDIVDLCASHTTACDGMLLPTHVCALDGAGHVWCWGSSYFRVLGVDTGVNSPEPLPTPQRIAGDTIFRSITCGAHHNCALDAAGTPWCWGTNYFGELGVEPSELEFSTTPVAVDAGPLVSITSASHAFHTCGLDAAGAAWCWGDNRDGQLGTDAGEAPHPTPVPVGGGHAFTSLVAGGGFTCGLDTAGAAWCWGDNRNGELGAGLELDFSGEPVPVAGDHVFVRLRTQDAGVCGQDTEHRLWCWGAAVFPWRLTPHGEPQAPELPPFPEDFQLAEGRICRMPVDGPFECLGSNRDGVGGRFTRDTVPFLNPVATERVLEVIGVWGGNFWALSGTTLLVWGQGGPLGFSDELGELHQHLPIEVALPEPMLQFGGDRLLLSKTGKLYSISLLTGQVGLLHDGPFIELRDNQVLSQAGESFEVTRNPFELTRVRPGETFRTIPTDVCSLDTRGKVTCWRRMPTQPGEEPAYELTTLFEDSDFVRLECTRTCVEGDCPHITCTAQEPTGGLVRWNLDDCAPAPLAPPEGSVSEFATGERTTCFLLADDRVFCMGENGAGQLGDGTYEDSDTMVEVRDEANFLMLRGL